jgi:uncharacterized protein
MAVFGGLDLRLDPWQVEYGSELPLGAPAEETERETVLADVERPVSDWCALTPDPGALAAAGALPRRLVFIDGVRRIEARVLARRQGRVVHGAFGSFGVGCVLVSDGTAVCGEAEIHRLLALDSGESVPEAIDVGPALSYRAVSVAESDPDAPLRRIQDEMRLCEERRARALADREGTLVVADGPLTFGDPLRGGAVGYIKRLFKLYLDPALLPILAQLPSGARTPLFALTSQRRFSRFSWFLRLAARHPGDSDLAGLVRLEVSDSVGVAAARRLADATTVLLPPFAPSRGRDPRAPQNLLPIGALEQQLRRRLGDARVIRRRLTTFIATEAVHA